MSIGRRVWKGLFILSIGLSSPVTLADTKKPVSDNDTKRLAVIAEAEGLYKKKQYAKAKEVLERADLLWTVDSVYARKQRLLGQILIRTGNYEEARHANLEVLSLQPDLTDTIYDNACASALEKRPADAVRQLEILWHLVAKDPGKVARYRKFLAKDPDFAAVRKQGGFRRVMAAFDKGVNPTRSGYESEPSVFTTVGDDLAEGLASHALLALKLCAPEKPVGFSGISLTVPAKLSLAPGSFRLPVCFVYAFASKDWKAAKKPPDLSFRFALTGPDGKTVHGQYVGVNNSRDHREGRVLEHPIDPPDDIIVAPPGAEPEGGDYVTGGNEITDISWHLRQVKPAPGRWTLRVYNDLYQSETRTFVVSLLKSAK